MTVSAEGESKELKDSLNFHTRDPFIEFHFAVWQCARISAGDWQKVPSS